MLDSLGGEGLDNEEFDDFVIDSDDENLLDLDLSLGEINLDPAPGARDGSAADDGGKIHGAADVGRGTKTKSAHESKSRPQSQQDAAALSLSSASGTTGRVHSTTAASLRTKMGAPAAAASGFVHPLQDIDAAPTRPATAPSISARPNNTGRTPPAAMSAEFGEATGADYGTNWTSFSNSVACLAKSAAASVQTAVETAEAAVLSAPPDEAATSQEMRMTAMRVHRNMTAPSSGGGGPQPLSYLERQRLLHQQYHAGNNPAGAPLSAGAARQPTPLAAPDPDRLTPLMTAPSRPVSKSISAPTLPTNTPDKVTSGLDTPTKTALIASALGKLLPGERVIVFLNNLRDVKDSTFPMTFVGSDDVLSNEMRSLLHDSHNGQEGSVALWCCVITLYRVAVFSYQADSQGNVLLEKDGGDDNKRHDDNRVIKQWLS